MGRAAVHAGEIFMGFILTHATKIFDSAEQKKKKSVKFNASVLEKQYAKIVRTLVCNWVS